jgi:hypothetical protein
MVPSLKRHFDNPDNTADYLSLITERHVRDWLTLRLLGKDIPLEEFKSRLSEIPAISSMIADRIVERHFVENNIKYCWTTHMWMKWDSSNKRWVPH